jgi:hypothetical protein
MSEQKPLFDDDDDDEYDINFGKYADISVDSDKEDLCDMFLSLSPGLRNIVVDIFKNAERKSKIYSDILTLLKTTKELYLMKRQTQNKRYMDTLEKTWETTIEKKQRLDTIIEYAEFFNIYPAGKEDLFFENFYNSCIKTFIGHSGGKRKKSKSKKVKKVKKVKRVKVKKCLNKSTFGELINLTMVKVFNHF